MEPREQRSVIETMPVVWIYSAHPADKAQEKAVKLGLEEEGIPCEVEPVQGDSAHTLATEAARASSLGVGIGLVGKAGEAALHHRDLSGDERLIELGGGDFRFDTLRRLGANAARFVKGVPLMPLVEEELPETMELPSCGISSAGTAAQPQTVGEIDLETLTRIVVEVVQKFYSSKVDS